MVKGTLNPVWNEDFELPLTQGGPLEVRIMDRDRLGHDNLCSQVPVTPPAAAAPSRVA